MQLFQLPIKPSISIKKNVQAIKVLIESIVYSNLNYCLLAQHFYKAESLQKVEDIQRRALQYLYDIFESDLESGYTEVLQKSEKVL